MNLIRPAAISGEIIVPSSPFGSSTDVMVFVTFLTLHRTKSPSSILTCRLVFICFHFCFKNVIYLSLYSVMNYRTSSTFARIFAFPDDGSASTVLQLKHLTFVDAFPKIVWDSLHLGHLTLMNFPFRSIVIDEEFGF